METICVNNTSLLLAPLDYFTAIVHLGICSLFSLKLFG